MKHAVAIILARGGSKGLPRKNLADVAGRPCVAWTIDHAAASTALDRIILSSDDDDILAVGRSIGTETHRRSPAAASDTAPVDTALREACKAMRVHPRAPIALLYGNVPVRPADLTDRAVALLEQTTADSVQSFAPAGKHHPLWAARADADTAALTPFTGDTLFNNIYRRQELPQALFPDGGVTLIAPRALRGEIPDLPQSPHAFLGRDRRALLTREGDVVDIDTETDRLVAHAILSQRNPCAPAKANIAA